MSKKEKMTKAEEEEIEEEEEQGEENQEEEVEEESEHTYANEIETNNTFIISLQLIKLFDNMKKSDNDSVIIDFLKNVGLPMHFNNEETLSLYLYFHKICIPFYDLLKSIKSETVSEIVLKSLQESYYLLADDDIKHFKNPDNFTKRNFKEILGFTNKKINSRFRLSKPREIRHLCKDPHNQGNYYLFKR